MRQTTAQRVSVHPTTNNGNFENMSEDEQNKVYNTKGLAPNLSMPVKGDASSTTKSAVAAGTIDIRENPAQDISALSRDTTNATERTR